MQTSGTMTKAFRTHADIILEIIDEAITFLKRSLVAIQNPTNHAFDVKLHETIMNVLQDSVNRSILDIRLSEKREVP